MSDVRPITSNADRRLLFRADGVFRALDGALGETQRAWLEELPLDQTVEVFDADEAGSPLRVAKPEIRQRISELDAQGGETWVDTHLRMTLALLLVRTLTRPVPYRLPQSVDCELAQERLRILDELASDESDPYKRGGRLLRDVAFCLGTALPFGIWAGRLSASVSRDVLDRAGLRHLRESPWLNNHLEIRPGHTAHTAEARARGTVLLADFFRVNPTYQGFYGVGWITDPNALKVSPHLSTPLHRLLEAGAVFVSLGSGEESTVRHATARSETRRRLYEEGEYTPTDYMTLFPRDRLIAWAEKRAREGSGAS